MWRDFFGLDAKKRTERIFADARLWRHCQSYNRAIAEVVGQQVPSPNYYLHGSWELGTPFGDLLNAKLFEVIAAFEESLIAEVHQTNVEGDIVEFGVYRGDMLKSLIVKAESILEKGETKAFFDWVPTVPQYRFEFIAQCNWRFYLRVHHR